MTESVQQKLKRVRPPRVKISYDVEIGNAIQKKELPFVGALIADLAGKSINNLPKFKERKFVDIDRDNFNDIVKSITPSVAFTVSNTLSGGDGDLNVALNFESLDDFEPAQIINQIEPLRKLFEARQRLNDLMAKLDGNDELDQLLSEIIADTDQKEKLEAELQASNGHAPSDDGSGADGEEAGDEA